MKLDGAPVSFDRRKALALLSYLAISQKRERRDELAALMWPEKERTPALAGLRRILRSINQALEDGDFLTADRRTIQVQSQKVWVDALKFEAAAERLLEAGPGKADSASEQIARLEKTVKLYRGDFLSGFSIQGSPGFDDWQRFQSDYYRRLSGRLLEGLVEYLEEAGDLEKAIDYAQLHLSQDRLSEEGHRRLMRLYLLAGNRSQAIRQFEHCKEILDEELGVEPEEATVQLYQRIRQGQIEAPPPRPSAPDTDQPRGPVTAYNLPELPTAFIGRESELTQVADRLQDPDCRLLTLIGSGGMGKTRLALESAYQARENFQNGVYFVPLAPINADSLAATIAEAVGVTLNAGAESEEQLINALAEKQLLLVLDNFEHLIGRVDLVSRMLARMSRAKLLVTSRERLNLSGEWLLKVKGLDVPETGQEDYARFSAVELFVQAAHRVQADFELSDENRNEVVEICRLLGGMPLGIELAAGWLRLLPCQQIIDEIRKNLDFLSSSLRDLPERHRSLRAVFQSSLNLLSERERNILVRLSECKGGFTLEAAQEVAQARLDQLVSLFDKSLLGRSSQHRYEMHELIRQFASELLHEEPPEWEAVRQKHGRYYLSLLHRKSSHLAGGAQQQKTVDELRQEIDNIRSAWLWALEEKQYDVLEDAIEGLHLLLLLISRYHEAQHLLLAALEAVPAKSQPVLWLKMASRLGRFSNKLGRYEDAQKWISKSLKLARREELDDEVGFALSALSVVFYHMGDFPRSIELAEESVGICRRLNNRHGLASALIQLGRTQGTVGDCETARETLLESYRIFEELQDNSGMARCLNNLGNAAHVLGDDDQALRHIESAFELMKQLGDLRGMAVCLNNSGLIWEEMGNHERAREFSLKSLKLFKESGYQGHSAIHRGPAVVLENLGRACFGLGEYETSKAYYVDALRSSLELKVAPVMLTALAGLARLLVHENNVVKAWQIARYVLQNPERTGEAAMIAGSILEDLEGSLSPEQKEEAEAEMKSLTPEKLVQEMLQGQLTHAAERA